jgi:hypothetical protein
MNCLINAKSSQLVYFFRYKKKIRQGGLPRAGIPPTIAIMPRWLPEAVLRWSWEPRSTWPHQGDGTWGSTEARDPFNGKYRRWLTDECPEGVHNTGDYRQSCAEPCLSKLFSNRILLPENYKGVLTNLSSCRRGGGFAGNNPTGWLINLITTNLYFNLSSLLSDIFFISFL